MGYGDGEAWGDDAVKAKMMQEQRDAHMSGRGRGRGRGGFGGGFVQRGGRGGGRGGYNNMGGASGPGGYRVLNTKLLNTKLLNSKFVECHESIIF